MISEELILRQVLISFDDHSVWKLFKMSHFNFWILAFLTIFGILKQLLSTQNVNIARFARNVEWDFLCDFQTLWITSKVQWILDITYDLKRFEISKFLGHPVLKSFLHKINAFEERKLFVIGETMPLERLQLFPQNTLKKWRRGNKRFPSLFSIHIFNICPTIFLLLCLMIMKAVAELSFMVGRFH